MKKYLLYAGMFLGSFLVINVGMYFFLAMTQPEPTAELHADADSAAVAQDTTLLAEVEYPTPTTEETDNSIPELSAQSPAPEADESTVTISEPTADHIQHEMVSLDTVFIEVAAVRQEQDPALQKEEVPAAMPSDSTITETVAEPQIEKSTPVMTSKPEPQPNPLEIRKLAKLLEGMKPDEAAAIASRLQVEEIVTLVMRMKDRKAAKLLAALPVEKAVRVAKRMSELVERSGTNS